MPKGVMWRQHDVIFTLGGGIDHATGIPCGRPEELPDKALTQPPIVTFAVPPLMHGAAQWAMLGSLFVGNKVVLHPVFDALEVWRIVGRERVNTVAITGDAMGRPLVEALAAHRDELDLGSLIVLASSAAIFSPVVKEQFKALLPNLVIVDSIGATESGFNGTAIYQSGAERREGAGVSVRPGRDTVVVDAAMSRRLEPGTGEVGKIARGGNVPLGYYKDPQKTAETFVTIDGRRYSIPGDFAKVEADGSITLLGRGSVCINSGGEKIYPEEVEAVLKSHPDVFDAVVVGVPDSRWGEKVAAVVQARPGRSPTLEALDVHCRPRLAGYKVPRALCLIPAIQRQPSGKPDYPWAKKAALAALES
jgi:acyl-CoA synthetase (AMP-forming)/AMP-acid ligase II